MCIYLEAVGGERADALSRYVQSWGAGQREAAVQILPPHGLLYQPVNQHTAHQHTEPSPKVTINTYSHVCVCVCNMCVCGVSSPLPVLDLAEGHGGAVECELPVLQDPYCRAHLAGGVSWRGGGVMLLGLGEVVLGSFCCDIVRYLL